MLATEQSNPQFLGLDTWPGDACARAFLQSQQSSLASIEIALPSIETASERIAQHLLTSEHGRLVYAGAGTSGLLAINEGMELYPTYGWPQSRLVMLLAGGLSAELKLNGSEEDNVQAGILAAEKTKLCADDVLIAVSASGNTPYTCALVEQAHKLNCMVIGIANNPDTNLLNLSDCPIFLETGSEVIAGSTRIGAGTAQRAALCILSSLIMIRLGNIYDNLMINLVADNTKLKQRAIAILRQITGATEPLAIAALEQTNNQVKPAVLVLQGLSAKQAVELLHEHQGQLRSAQLQLDQTL